MIAHAAEKFGWPRSGAVENGRRGGGLRLMRYFTATSLIAFMTVGAALYILQTMEEVFFAAVQREQTAFFAQTQTEFMRQQESSARDDLLALHQSSHVNLTHVFSNLLGAADLNPFIAKAQQVPVEHCRGMGANKATGDALAQSDAKRACFGAVGQRIMSLPQFAVLNAKMYDAIRKSTVFKIKVFDLRGITVYSSEHKQIGEDKAGNQGWRAAVGGTPASELTHRDRFSAFEGEVENRDLISSYIPMLTGTNQVVGVFEIYSDVTPFLKQIRDASQRIAGLAAANQARVEQAAHENQHKVDTSSDQFLMIVGGLLAVLYGVLLLIVRHGQRVIDLQNSAQERAIQREEQWHREKMAALATMAANVAHEVGNPLATISGLAEEIAEQQKVRGCAVCKPMLLLEQTRRIANMSRQIADFASAHNEAFEPVDVNQMVKAVCDFLGFDQRFRAMQIEFKPGARLPACIVIPDHLNEALMNLLQACMDGKSTQRWTPKRIVVETRARGKDILIRIVWDTAALGGAPATGGVLPDSRFESARRRVKTMGGQLSSSATAIELTLPTTPADGAT
ncbi:sensor histidine kinase [Rhodoferax sp.]|uniref:sensor histidine kinase n=1 Tax=Rhodoferax sp. TaxID=50421 RepID=UPI00276E2974|nr:hypothetical protein [Rhodoferax sp.]